MTTVIITPDDLAPFAEIDPAKAAAMIDDATAIALRLAPCLADTTDVTVIGMAKAILRAAILRWNDAGSGEVTQQTSGPFTTTYTQQARKSLFWPSEIEQLQALCRDSGASDAFAIDTVPDCSLHLPWCSLMFGAAYCSCGVDIAGEPIFEQP